jgi:hypothetical protein
LLRCGNDVADSGMAVLDLHPSTATCSQSGSVTACIICGTTQSMAAETYRRTSITRSHATCCSGTARSMYAAGNGASTPVKARGPPPLPEANGFAGRPPSPSLLNEVKFLVGNSAPSAGQSPPSVRISSAADAIVGTRASRPTSSAAALGAGDHRLLHASGVSIHGPHLM